MVSKYWLDRARASSKLKDNNTDKIETKASPGISEAKQQHNGNLDLTRPRVSTQKNTLARRSGDTLSPAARLDAKYKGWRCVHWVLLATPFGTLAET